MTIIVTLKLLKTVFSLVLWSRVYWIVQELYRYEFGSNGTLLHDGKEIPGFLRRL